MHELYNEEYFKSYLNNKQRCAAYNDELIRIKDWLPSVGKVLDIGCGTGEFLRLGSGSVFAGYDLYGVEVSEYAANLAAPDITMIDEDEIGENFEGFFDVIIMRGVLQHLPNPLEMIQKCYKALSEGGILIFLATPNANSIYYKLWGTLPALDPKYNFMIPSDIELKNILINFGFDVKHIEYPYGYPYAHWTDGLKFAAKLFGTKFKFAWPRNMMEIYARKPVTTNTDTVKPAILTISNMSLGDLIDSKETIILKIEHHTDPIILKQLEEQRKIISLNIMMIENDILAFVSYPKHKVYDVGDNLDNISYDEASEMLRNTVRDLWNLQEFVNLKQYKIASKDQLMSYIEDLDTLNRKRNYLIDRVNLSFRETHQ
jgi:SAM-dependent methyltransferase